MLRRIINPWQIADWTTGPRGVALVRHANGLKAVTVGRPNGQGAYDLVAIVPYDMPNERSEALDDARIMVRSVNLHADLVDALRLCASALAGIQSPDAKTAHDAARVALNRLN